jgi:hypothetical protein
VIGFIVLWTFDLDDLNHVRVLSHIMLDNAYEVIIAHGGDEDMRWVLVLLAPTARCRAPGLWDNHRACNRLLMVEGGSGFWLVQQKRNIE